MSTIPSIDPAVPPLGKRGAFEGVARRHGRRRNPARMTPRSSLRTPTNPALHSPQRWVEKADRSIKGSDTPHDVEHLTERASAFERFHNAQHRYSATGGFAPDETATQSTPRTPVELAELPAGWPKCGKVEFIRFIRSDHKLRILGRAIQLPDGSAYQYVTATLDLALTAEEHNLLISSDQGELLTTGRLPIPAR